MSQSVMDALWDAVTASVAGLSLLDPSTGTLLPVVKRKLLRRESGLDGSAISLTQITIFRPEQPEKVKYAAFGGVQFWTYSFAIALIYPGNQDNAGYISQYAAHRDAIRELFEPPWTYPVLGVTGAFDMRVEADVWLPRSMIAINYDYQSMKVDITAVG